MAIAITCGKLLEKIILISVLDDSIDWDSSLFEEEYKNEEISLTGTEAKKAHYQKTYDISKLKFLDGKIPTCFIFKNPERYEIGSKLTDIFVRCSGVVTKKEPVISEIHEKLWSLAFIGHVDAKPQDISLAGDTLTMLQKPFISGNLTSDFIQVMYQAGVLEELSNAVQARKKTK